MGLLKLREQSDSWVDQLSVFAKRSCKYLKVPQSEKKRIHILRLYDIRFFRSGRLLSRVDPQLEYTDCVSKTFKWQKKDKGMDTVTQTTSGNRLLCPVRLDAALISKKK